MRACRYDLGPAKPNPRKDRGSVPIHKLQQWANLVQLLNVDWSRWAKRGRMLRIRKKMKTMTNPTVIRRQEKSRASKFPGPCASRSVATVIAGLSLAFAVPLQAAPLPGAIFTTNQGCTGVNVNIYSDKDDVYIDGGPRSPGAAAFPDGEYYVQVTAPGGYLLGTSVGAKIEKPYVVVDGEPQACYQLSAILIKASELPLAVPGYDSTSNPGGEYKVWVSTVPTFDNNSTKTDNFKVKEDGVVIDTAILCVDKFYDANVNGIADPGELYIDGWKVQISDGISMTRFTPVCVTVEATDPESQTPLYNVFEFSALEPHWIHTTPQSVDDIELLAGTTTTVVFGNVSVGPGGGHTLGFWSNRNGQALFGTDDLALMVSLNLRNADGFHFNPGSYMAFRSWLLAANATNMSYILSAQLAAMKLNVFNGKVDGGALIHAPGAQSANPLGFATVSDIMGEADTELKLCGLVLSGSPFRGYQEALKNALDDANNNLNFVQAAQCPFTFDDDDE